MSVGAPPYRAGSLLGRLRDLAFRPGRGEMGELHRWYLRTAWWNGRSSYLAAALTGGANPVDHAARAGQAVRKYGPEVARRHGVGTLRQFLDICWLGVRHPGYGFARHQGYPTRAHRAALAWLGPCAHHRRGFAPVDAAWAAQPLSARDSPGG